jgi:hypothetical protein
MLLRFKNAFHNVVLHPIAGLLWLLGLQRAGDWFHGTNTAEANLEEAYPILDFFSPEEQLTAEQRRHTYIVEAVAWAKRAPGRLRIDRLLPILFASAANLDRLEAAAADDHVVATATCKETGKIINLYEGNFVDDPGNGDEVDTEPLQGWDHVTA